MKPYSWAGYILAIILVYSFFARMISTEMYKSQEVWRYQHGQAMLPADPEGYSKEYFQKKALDILKFFHLQ